MMKPRKEVFSVTKAVKSNARDQVGQPKAVHIIEEKPRPGERGAKHKESLEELIEHGEGEE